MLSIPIIGPSFDQIEKQVSEAANKGDLLEFRIDHFDEHATKNLKFLKIPLPVIFTLRTKAQGGSYKGSEKERLKKIKELAALQPEYFDLEYDIGGKFVEEMLQEFPNIKSILSYHDFRETPRDLEVILKKMHETPAHLYKIACKANSMSDSLRMLHFVKTHAPLLGMCMGEKGKITRILGPKMGCPWIYTALSLDQQSAKGQLTCEELAVYPLNHSAIYGLIGDPVDKSIGHYTHNKVMKELGVDGIYVKMQVEKDELEEFFLLAKKIGIKGLSVTMPLKESVIPFLDHIDDKAKKIGAVNTILFQEGKLIGYNTDGKGALDAIEAKLKVQDKKVIVLGAGGSARSIAYEALLRGGDVLILNRTKEKAERLAKHFGVRGGGLDALKGEYAILINTTPEALPISPDEICPHSLVMDIKAIPKMSPLLDQAMLKECTLVFGYEMFVNQAVEQFALWFSSRLDGKNVKEILLKETRMWL